MGVVRGAFPARIPQPVDEIILFHRLQRERDGPIVEIQFARLQKLLEDRKITLDARPTRRATGWPAKGYDPAYGARPLKRVIQRNLQDPLGCGPVDSPVVPTQPITWPWRILAPGMTPLAMALW
jgi:ATP-dependent Clp protease ATP-binding subunit ClpB